VYAVNDLRKVFLLIKVCEFKDEALLQAISISTGQEEISTDLRETDVPYKVKEVVDIV
jgi:hypothetical protein